MATVTVKGGAALDKALLALGDSVTARKIGRLALKAAGAPIEATAKALAPDDPATGPGRFLRDSIKLAPISAARVNRGQSLSGDREDQLWMAVGIDKSDDPPTQKPRKSGRGSYRDPGVAGVSVIIEFGRAGVAAQPFMRAAWDANKGQAIGRMTAIIGPEVDKAARRAAKRNARLAAKRQG